MKTITIEILSIDGTKKTEHIETHNILQTLQHHVGGFIEIIWAAANLPDEKIIIVNDEGLTWGLPTNPFYSGLVGNIVIMMKTDFQ